MLTDVTFVGHNQPVRNQPQIKSNYTYNLINTCNIINYSQGNKPVKNWYRVKYRPLNRRPNKGTITNSS